ncbi:hypothetical protein [Nocardioides sp. AX2bis]|uniref:hypothetical protein n=1 Tax=Nocardioides sp. AX2bis TaxID=2653157 RepID=UPI00135C61EA|nr:hypothetical protein [Nocardioides sp. AX2bis]
MTLDPQARAPYTVVDLVVTRGPVPGRPEGDSCDVVPPARCADPFLGAGRYVVRWVPGPSGRVEVLLRRGPDTVLVRLAGWDVPVGYDAVVAQTSWVGLTAVMADRERFAPLTPRRVAERSET